MDSHTRNAFVCGHPISHSRSPIIHRHWLEQYALNGTYRAIDIKPDDFPDFISKLAENNFIGGNVTIPHKEAAFSLAAHTDDVCHIIGAANTLWIEDKKVHATNTDAHGFAANLDQYAANWDQSKSALVLGAGGASRAVIYALQQRGFLSVMVANRSLARAVELKHRFGPTVSAHTLSAVDELAGDAGLIINTTSLGMNDTTSISLDFSKVKSTTIVTDIVYVPLLTPLLRSAAEAGLQVVDGLGMLLHQAAPGFEKWFGRLPIVTQNLRDKIIQDMAQRL